MRQPVGVRVRLHERLGVAPEVLQHPWTTFWNMRQETRFYMTVRDDLIPFLG